MNIIGDTPAASATPAEAGECNALELDGLLRMQHDGASALIQILMQVMDAAHQNITLSIQALAAVHDVCDAVTVGWMMARAQQEPQPVSLTVGG